MQLQAVLQLNFVMRIQIVLLVFVFIFGFTLIDNSYGQRDAASREDPSLPQVSLQLQLRNSEGQLVTYLEPTVMHIPNIAMVHEFLDTIKDKKIIEKNGEKFELIQYDSKVFFSTTKQIATYAMVHKKTHVLLFRHDGYIATPGDILDISWKIIRTIQ